VVRISFEDSANCGGSNALTQHGTATRRVCLDVPMRLTIQMVGLVETQNAGFEVAEARVDGQLVASGSSFGEEGGCVMRETSDQGSIDLAAGEHLIELSASTNDELYHVGAYWEFTFSWELLP
jgi:hypothetical protein